MSGSTSLFMPASAKASPYPDCQKVRRKRYGTYDRRGTIPNQVSIDDRPAIVAARKRFGDLVLAPFSIVWEGDTLIGKGHKGAVVTLVERKPLYTVMEIHKTAGAVRYYRKWCQYQSAVKKALTPHKNRVHTLTCDNGRELTDHQGMAKDLETKIYFAHPYASWERGVNENTHGLIRQYFPKHRDQSGREPDRNKKSYE